ncbi:MAG: HAD-IA family hydrolase [Flavobacteriaceae bacterium]|nr:HAD-IA family hydrolase [Flavobacteriaceae bacterium]
MKKVLIVTYYWPPAGGPGVQRWLKFVKYLPEFGIEPHVYVPENPNYPIVDETLVSESNPAINIIKHPIFEPYALGKLISKRKTNRISSGIITEKNPSLMEKFLLFIRGNLFIPDARMFWVNPSKRFLKKYIQDHHIDTLITSGPPHSLHLIGLKLKKELNIRWIADFRDPWTTISYHSKLRMLQFVQKKHLRMEQEVLQTADEIIVTSRTLQQAYQKITKKSISLITNGFDHIQSKKIKGSGIENYFTHIITSEAAGVKKPNPKIFEYAVTAAGSKPNQSMMVGDNLEADILGALDFGMQAVFFNPKEPNFELKTLEINHLGLLKKHL